MTEPFSMPPDCPLDEVEWRADSEPYQRGGGLQARWVPHLTYAICAELMDQWVGPNNWRIDGYKPSSWADGGLVCQVSVRFAGDDEWVPRQGAGDVPGGQHSVKGAETDAFKRCVGRSWGCGRNVYKLPTLYAPCGSYQARSGKSVATMIDTTVPALVKQLKQLGFDPGEHVKVAADGHSQDDTTVEAPTTTAGAEAATPPVPASPSEPTSENLMEMLGTLHAQKDVIAQLRSDGLWPLGHLVGPAHEQAKLVLQAAHAAEKLAAQ